MNSRELSDEDLIRGCRKNDRKCQETLYRRYARPMFNLCLIYEHDRDNAKDILQEYGNYEWLTENGSFVVLNNGIEFAATYFIMLLSLFFIGSGRFVSVDYYLKQHLIKACS